MLKVTWRGCEYSASYSWSWEFYMGMHNPTPPCPSGVLAVSLSSYISEGLNDGVCIVHVLSIGLFLSLTVGWVSSTSLTIAGPWSRGYFSYQVCTAAADQNWWYWLYHGAILKVDTLSLGPSGTFLVNYCLSTFRRRMISYAPIDYLLCWFCWDWSQSCGMRSMYLPYGK